MRHVLRIQDNRGRGPFKPGMSSRWADATGNATLPPMFEEFGWECVNELQKRIDRYGGHCGCAVADRAVLDRWFTPAEQSRLRALGYQIVQIGVDLIVRESANQIVFWRLLPLKWNVIVIPWAAAATPT